MIKAYKFNSYGDLKAIDGTVLNDQDFVFLFIDGVLTGYELDANSGLPENIPAVISPNTNAGNKRWIRATPGVLIDTDFSDPTDERVPSTQAVKDFVIANSGMAIEDEGTPLESRPVLDFQGAGVTVTDQASPAKTIITIPGGGTGHAIEGEGTPLNDRPVIDFVGAGVTVTDQASPAKTIVTIQGITYATSAEINTGTEATKPVSPDALAGSNAGCRIVQIAVIDFATDITTGDGKAYFVVPTELNGMNLIRVAATVITAGTTNATTIQIANVTDAVDMLSTLMNIESTETSTRTSATPGTIDTSKDDVATGDVLRIDIDAVSTTAPKGLIVEMVFQLP